jgi:hypothetical protein
MSSTRKRYGGQSDKDLHQTLFLAAFAASCSVQKAATWANIHRQTHYDWMRKDATYPARFEEARQRAADMLEDEAVRRAVHGIRRPVLYRGKQVYIQGEPVYQVAYSDELLIRLLEAWKPEKYGRRNEQTNLLELDWTKLNESQWAMLMEAHLKQVLGTDDPKVLESAMRQIEAGKTVIDIDAVSPTVETRST